MNKTNFQKLTAEIEKVITENAENGGMVELLNGVNLAIYTPTNTPIPIAKGKIVCWIYIYPNDFGAKFGKYMFSNENGEIKPVNNKSTFLSIAADVQACARIAENASELEKIKKSNEEALSEITNACENLKKHAVNRGFLRELNELRDLFNEKYDILRENGNKVISTVYSSES